MNYPYPKLSSNTSFTRQNYLDNYPTKSPSYSKNASYGDLNKYQTKQNHMEIYSHEHTSNTQGISSNVHQSPYDFTQKGLLTPSSISRYSSDTYSK